MQNWMQQTTQLHFYMSLACFEAFALKTQSFRGGYGSMVLMTDAK